MFSGAVKFLAGCQALGGRAVLEIAEEIGMSRQYVYQQKELVIISNHIDNAEEAIHIYRAKDVVEKGFLRMKNCLELARLRVHSDNAMQNKIFIGFISLIITAHIHKVMSEHRMYDTWTMKKLIKILERLRVHHIKNDTIFSPLTKEQKLIFEAFGLDSKL